MFATARNRSAGSGKEEQIEGEEENEEEAIDGGSDVAEVAKEKLDSARGSNGKK